MTLFELFGLVVTLIAGLGYVNHRFVRLPETIGIMALAMLMSMGMAGYGLVKPEGGRWAAEALAGINFTEVVFHGMLGLLLFAGSITLELKALAREKGAVLVLATVGVIVSTLIVGHGFHLLTALAGYPIPLIHCMLLGAVVSPTDPVAVLGVLRRAGMTPRLQMQIAGESLFNDATGVVAVLTVLALMGGDGEVGTVGVLGLLARQSLGGIGLGTVLGAVGLLLLRGAATSPVLCIMTTLALATGGFALGEHLGVSPLITVIVSGLIVGNYGRSHAMSREARDDVFTFWELIDQLLNLVLFGLIGITVIALQPTWLQFGLALAAVPIALVARAVSVALPVAAMSRFRPFDEHTIPILTWGGLRGGLSIALALSLPWFLDKPVVLGATYAIVIFSILVQALTLGPLVRRLRARGRQARGAAGAPSRPADEGSRAGAGATTDPS